MSTWTLIPYFFSNAVTTGPSSFACGSFQVAKRTVVPRYFSGSTFPAGVLLFPRVVELVFSPLTVVFTAESAPEVVSPLTSEDTLAPDIPLVVPPIVTLSPVLCEPDWPGPFNCLPLHPARIDNVKDTVDARVMMRYFAFIKNSSLSICVYVSIL